MSLKRILIFFILSCVFIPDLYASTALPKVTDVVIDYPFLMRVPLSTTAYVEHNDSLTPLQFKVLRRKLNAKNFPDRRLLWARLGLAYWQGIKGIAEVDFKKAERFFSRIYQEDKAMGTYYLALMSLHGPVNLIKYRIGGDVVGVFYELSQKGNPYALAQLASLAEITDCNLTKEQIKNLYARAAEAGVEFAKKKLSLYMKEKTEALPVPVLNSTQREKKAANFFHFLQIPCSFGSPTTVTSLASCEPPLTSFSLETKQKRRIGPVEKKEFSFLKKPKSIWIEHWENRLRAQTFS